MSAPGLKEEVELALKELRGEHLGRQVNPEKIIFWIILMKRPQKTNGRNPFGKEKC